MRKRITSIWILPGKVEFDRNNEHGYAGHHAYKRQRIFTPTSKRLGRLITYARLQHDGLSYSEPFNVNGSVFAMVISKERCDDDNR